MYVYNFNKITCAQKMVQQDFFPQVKIDKISVTASHFQCRCFVSSVDASLLLNQGIQKLYTNHRHDQINSYSHVCTASTSVCGIYCYFIYLLVPSHSNVCWCPHKHHHCAHHSYSIQYLLNFYEYIWSTF